MTSKVELQRAVNARDLYRETIPGLAAANTSSNEAIDTIHRTAMYGITAVHLDGILQHYTPAAPSSILLGGLRRNVETTRALGDYAAIIKGTTEEASTGLRFEVAVPVVTAARVNGLVDQITTKVDAMAGTGATERNITRAAAWGVGMLALLQPYYDGNKGAARGLYSLVKQRQGLPLVHLEQPKDEDGNVGNSFVTDHGLRLLIDLYRAHPELLPHYLPYDRPITPQDILGVPAGVRNDIWVPAKKESLYALLSAHADEIDQARLPEIVRDDTVDQYRRLEQGTATLR